MVFSDIYQWLDDNWDEYLRPVVLMLAAMFIAWICYKFRTSFSSMFRKGIRRLRWRYGHLQDAIKIFDGGVELLDKRRLSNRASPERIEQFYKGEGLHWDVIAANADIERDQEKQLMKLLSSTPQVLRIVCVTGGSWVGKSTLAWRAAARLYWDHKAVVMRVIYGHDPQLWGHMHQFWRDIRHPFYILADDIFRKDEVVEMLRTLDPYLPVTILATSQVSEYRPHGLTCHVVELPLKNPTQNEKKKLLAKRGIRKEDLTPDQQKRLEKATSFGVMMTELTTGEDHAKAFERTVEHLKSKDPVGYRAYEYVSFCYQYEVCIPLAVLNRLDSEGRFHRLADRQSVQGLIFKDDAFPHALNAGHSRTAVIRFRSYFRAPHLVLLEIAKAIDPADGESRKFLGFLVLRMLRLERHSIEPGLQELVPIIRRVRQKAAEFSEVRLWLACFSELGLHEEVEACETALLSTSPMNSWECVYLASLLDGQQHHQDALDVLTEYIGRHPHEGHHRPMYLRIVEQYGTRDQRKEAMRETRKWLADHQEDNYVRTTFLGFVERKGSDELKRNVLKETRKWLAAHQEDNSVRTAFLGFVERKGSDELKRNVLKETRKWLTKHPENSGVRTAFLGLVENKAPEMIPEIMDKMQKWLAAGPADHSVRLAAMGLIRRKGSDQQLHKLVETLRGVLSKQSQSKDSLAKLFDCAIGDKDLEEAFQTELRNAIDEYGADRIAEQWQTDPNKQCLFANYLRDGGYFAEAEVIYKTVLAMPLNQTSRTIQWEADYHYGLLLSHLGRFAEAAKQFQNVLNVREDHIAARLKRAYALRELGRAAAESGDYTGAHKCFLQAESELDQALHWARVHNADKASIYAASGWLYITSGEFEKSITALEKANDEVHGGSWLNHWGIGKAQLALGHLNEALLALGKAWNLAPQHLYPPASEEIPELLRQCREALDGDKGDADYPT